MEDTQGTGSVATTTGTGGAPADTSVNTTTVGSDTPGNTSTAPATNGEQSGQVGQDFQVQYKKLQEEHAQVSKNYAELRKKLVAQGTERNTYQKQFEEMKAQQAAILESLRKATAEAHDPDKFLEEFKTQGPEYIKNLLQKEREAIKAEMTEGMSQLVAEVNQLRVDKVLDLRRADPVKYPDFAKLENAMKDIYLSGQFPFDPANLTVEELVDKLYNLTRLQHSTDAIKAAVDLGKSNAEAEARKEAQTSVTGGGKHSGVIPANASDMSAAAMRKHFESIGMVE